MFTFSLLLALLAFPLEFLDHFVLWAKCMYVTIVTMEFVEEGKNDPLKSPTAFMEVLEKV